MLSADVDPYDIVWSCSPNEHTHRTTNRTVITICTTNVVKAIAPVFVALITVMGNACVILAVVCAKKLRRRQTSILIGNLALADFLVGVLVMPFSISNLVSGDGWLFSRMLCHLWVGMDVVCCTASIVTLGVISVDRFIGVTKPLQYSTLVTRSRLLVANAGVWVFSIVTLCMTFNWSEQAHASTVCDVDMELEHVTLSTICSFYVPAFIILCVYAKVYRVTQNRHHMMMYSKLPFSGATATVTNGLAKKPTFRKRWQSVRHLTRCRLGVPEQRPSPTARATNGSLSNRASLLMNRMKQRCSVPTNTEGNNNSMQADSLSTTSCRANLTRWNDSQQLENMPALRIHYGGSATNCSTTAIEAFSKQRRTFIKQKKTANTLAMVVGCFFICWLPFFVSHLINNGVSEVVPPNVMVLFTWLGYVNSAINPMIYALTMKSFHDTLLRCLRRGASPVTSNTGRSQRFVSTNGVSHGVQQQHQPLRPSPTRRSVNAGSISSQTDTADTHSCIARSNTVRTVADFPTPSRSRNSFRSVLSALSPPALTVSMPPSSRRPSVAPIEEESGRLSPKTPTTPRQFSPTDKLSASVYDFSTAAAQERDFTSLAPVDLPSSSVVTASSATAAEPNGGGRVVLRSLSWDDTGRPLDDAQAGWITFSLLQMLSDQQATDL